jgi:hypothetical protein
MFSTDIFFDLILAFLNPELIALCGGISTIIRAALDCHQYPRINESLVSTILYLLNHPRTRHLIKFNTDLEVSQLSLSKIMSIFSAAFIEPFKIWT